MEGITNIFADSFLRSNNLKSYIIERDLIIVVDIFIRSKNRKMSLIL